ncbi:MAG TPA: alpha/beta fold hydrolase [Kofleriaceae bacterium]|nr:alpha/beta fold hydrolase [Kofleriaceae bacterium]
MELPAVTAVTADGVRLVMRRFAPATGAARAAVLCTHAMMVHGRYFHGRDGGFAAALAGQGLDVFVLDWRGHGDSKPPAPKGGTWTFDDYVTLDLPAALAAVGAAAGCRPAEVAVLGHSLGGLVTLASLGTGVVKVRRLVLAATSVWLPGPDGPWRRRATMRVYDGVARVLGYAPIKRLGFGSEDEPASYVRQLAGWARTGRWTSHDGIDYLASLAHVDVPAWAIVGAGDGLCAPEDAAVLTRRMPRTVPMRVVSRAGGDAFDPDHFTLFTRPDMAPVWIEIARALE